MKTKIATVQMNCKLGDIRANLATIRKLSRMLSKYHPEIICFPELATTGYSLNERWRSCAEEIPGETSEELSKVASELGAYLICGMGELDPNTRQIYDSSVLISPNGRLAGVYRKVHLWDKERKYFTRGPGFPVFQTRFGKIGMGICYDIEFPEAARSLTLKGAQIVFFPSAEMSPMENYVDTYAVSRAAENCCFLAFSNRTGTEYKTHFFGRSQIVSPECKVLARATSTRPLATAEIDLSILRKLRPKLPYLSQLVPDAYFTFKPAKVRARKSKSINAEIGL